MHLFHAYAMSLIQCIAMNWYNEMHLFSAYAMSLIQCVAGNYFSACLNCVGIYIYIHIYISIYIYMYDAQKLLKHVSISC